MSEYTKEIEAIYATLREHYSVAEKRLSASLSINRELGIDEDDADEFLDHLAKNVGKHVSTDFSRFSYVEGLIQFGRRESLTVRKFAELIREQRQID